MALIALALLAFGAAAAFFLFAERQGARETLLAGLSVPALVGGATLLAGAFGGVALALFVFLLMALPPLAGMFWDRA